MQIKTAIDTHIEKNSFLDSTRAILFFGQDSGLVTWRISNIKKSFSANGFEIISLSYSEIKDNLRLISDEANNSSLFSKKKLVIVSLDASVIKKELSNIILANQGSLIVLAAGDLATKSELRKLFEINENIYSYGCYAMAPYEREKFAENYVRSNALSLPSFWIKKISMMVEDLAMLTSELDKIDLYKKGSSSQEIPDELIFSFSDYSFLDFAYAYALNNKKKMVHEYYKAVFSGVQTISLVRVLINFHLRLYMYKLSSEVYGREAAMMKISPPVFFKEKTEFQRVDNIKNLQLVVDKITNLNKMELIMKSGLVENESFFLNFLLHDEETSNIHRVVEALSETL